MIINNGPLPAVFVCCSGSHRRRDRRLVGYSIHVVHSGNDLIINLKIKIKNNDRNQSKECLIDSSLCTRCVWNNWERGSIHIWFPSCDSLFDGQADISRMCWQQAQAVGHTQIDRIERMSVGGYMKNTQPVEVTRPNVGKVDRLLSIVTESLWKDMTPLIFSWLEEEENKCKGETFRTN